MRWPPHHAVHVTPQVASEACPFIDHDEATCGSHFSLARLTQTFDDCLGEFHLCPHYQRLHRERPHRMMQPTIHGHTTDPTHS